MSGIAALAPEHRWVNDGLERADSYCTNPHKWMGVNFDCDLFWTADRGRPARRAQHPARVPPLGGRRDRGGDRLPRLADPARAPLPGAQAVVDAAARRRRRRSRTMIRRHVELTQRLAAEVAARRPLRDRRPAPAQPAVHPPRRRRRGDRRPDRAGQRHRRRRCSPAPSSTAAVALRFSIGSRSDRVAPRRRGLGPPAAASPIAVRAISARRRG